MQDFSQQALLNLHNAHQAVQSRGCGAAGVAASQPFDLLSWPDAVLAAAEQAWARQLEELDSSDPAAAEVQIHMHKCKYIRPEDQLFGIKT